MSEQKDFGKYLAGEWYPGCPVGKSEWRQNFESYMAEKESQVPMRPEIVRPAPKKYVRKPLTPEQYKHRLELVRICLRKRREYAKENGMCVDLCKRPARPGSTICQVCSEHRIARNKRKAA